MAPTFRDRALVLGETLVIADLHLGRAASTAIEAPVGDGADICERLDGVVDTVEPKAVVLAGDIMHAFETVPRGVERQLRKIDARVERAGAELVLVSGNHDTMLESVWDGAITDSYWLDAETLVVHGHEMPSADAERYVFGHDHPAIEIEGQRHPCFLEGPGGPDGAHVFVLPSFNRFTSGVVINQMRAREFQSPLVTDADLLTPIVRDESAAETLRFPPLGSFRHHLS